MEKFAEAIGIGVTFLSQIERSIKMPSINTLVKIINELDISADVLLRDEVVADKPYVLNEMTEQMKDLSPGELKMVSDVLNAMLVNMNRLKDDDDDYPDEC